jgi:SAM-dependent methyltransferase
MKNRTNNPTDKKITCPLCTGNSHTCIEEIKTDDLDRLYRRLYKAPIARLFPKQSSIDMLECQECKLIWFNPMQPGDEDFYNALQRFPWYYADHKNEFDVAARHIKIEDRVLEVGSGKGNFGRFVNCTKYVGLDFSQKARELAQMNGIDVRVETIEIHSRSNREKYDVVCAFQVLEHVSDISGFLHAMISSIRSGGRLIIAVPSQDTYISRSHNLALNLPPHHLSRFKDTTLKDIIKYYPLILDELVHDPLQPQHYGDYLYQLGLEALRIRTGVPFRSVNNSLVHFLLRIPSKLMSNVLAGALRPENTPLGHTVTAVYTKK